MEIGWALNLSGSWFAMAKNIVPTLSLNLGNKYFLGKLFGTIVEDEKILESSTSTY